MKIKSMKKIENRIKSQRSCASPAYNRPDKASCCGPTATVTGGEISDKVPGFLGWMTTPAGRVPQITSELLFRDHLGACLARWGIGRMEYILPAGLYAIGYPTAADPVVVTCNYKMTFDIVRNVLSGRNLWLLVLETFGVNVWCAAGKGSFGTGELVRRISATELAKAVSHRRLILPILGAPGVAAHEVARRSGFAVSYATIRAADLPEYLDSGMVTTSEMRQLTFSLYERLVLIPMELVAALKSIAVTGSVILVILTAVVNFRTGLLGLSGYLGACFAGIALGPLFLPWLPGRSFAVKGAGIGLLWSTLFYTLAGGKGWHNAVAVALFLALLALSAFYTLNFTGCTTYTSRSGVKKEMRIALPLIGVSLIVSLILLLLARFW